MANAINLAQQFVPVLDKVYKSACLTAVMDGSSELAKQGASAHELVIPTMEMDGLGDYSRNSGYAAGDVTLTYQTVECNFDRGRMFTVDAMDDQESAGIAFGQLSGEFIRTKVAPELDAFRFASYASAEGISKASGSLTTGAAVVKAIRAAVTKMDEDEVAPESRYLFITPTLKGLVEDMETTQSRQVMDGFAEVICVPQSRFYTAITQAAGGAGGYTKAATGKNINFMILEKSALIQYPKHIAPKIVSPQDNPDADAWKFGYRQVGIAQVSPSKAAGIYLHAVQ